MKIFAYLTINIWFIFTKYCDSPLSLPQCITLYTYTHDKRRRHQALARQVKGTITALEDSLIMPLHINLLQGWHICQILCFNTQPFMDYIFSLCVFFSLEDLQGFLYGMRLAISIFFIQSLLSAIVQLLSVQRWLKRGGLIRNLVYCCRMSCHYRVYRL